MDEGRSAGGYNYKTLLCTNIPEIFLDKFVARSHFNRFGNLVNFVLRPRRMTCMVSYASEAEAAAALRDGNFYNGHEFEITYAENESTPAQKTEEWVDPEVQAELSALSLGWNNEYLTSKTTAGKPTARLALVSTTNNVERERERERQRASFQLKTTMQELETVIRKPAHTSEEKYRVLDARDKLLRLNQRGMAMEAHRLQGHCSDMCPEKERVLREFQRQVAIYELKPGSDEQIAHELALKQYSRSSADQETPLPHELRTESALHMTMNYLMHEIMDISEKTDNLGDWFHFVWDRTRSIRKEITQQELCSLSAVKLVEQCARFHIHCAARLVAEDPNVFDAKINAENLTKCLQTLKYMYHDLRLKGVQCPREAEFRGYIVLLNLRDANFLWDIAQLPVELQKCPEIRRAIQFHLALQDTNFVRFFQLLREPETSYLSACILLTYFMRLRILALHRIVQAYRAPRKYEVSSLPVPYIRQMLLFPSDAETIEFVESCGLNVNHADRVELTRIHAPEHYKLSRQYELVESKRRQSVGECICGEPLPPKSLYKDHLPHNSFNDQGYLNSSAWTARDQMPNDAKLEEEAAQTSAKTEVAISSPDAEQTTPSSLPMDNVFKVPLSSTSTLPKINWMTPPPSIQLQPDTLPAPTNNKLLGEDKLHHGTTPGFASIMKSSPIGFSFAAAAAGAAAGGILNAASDKLQQKAADEAKLAALQQAIAAAKQRELELVKMQQAKAEQAKRAQAMKRARQLLIEQQQARETELRQQEAINTAAIAAAAAAVSSMEECVLQRQLEVEREEQSEQILSALIENQLVDVCQREWRLHHTSLVIYESLLKEQILEISKQNIQRADYELGLLRYYWQRWRNYRRVKERKDALFDCLPLSYGSESTQRLVTTRSAEQPLRLMRRYRQGEACDYRQLLDGMEDNCWLKLDLWELLACTLQQQQPLNPGARHYFKLLLSLPDNNLGIVIEHALDRGLLQKPTTKCDPNSESGASYISGLSHGVALCVHKLIGIVEPHSKQPKNADGIICFVDAKHLAESRQRLHTLIQQSGCSYVAFIVQYKLEETNLANELELDLLRAYRIFECHNMASGKRKFQVIALVQCAVQFLARQPHRSRGQLLQVELREWLIWHLGDELFQRLRYAAQQDETIGRHCRQSLQFCAQLYNEAVRRLQVVTGENLDDCPQLPEELRIYVEPQTPLPNRLEYFAPGWQSRHVRSKIVELLEKAKLPEMPPLPAFTEQSQQEVCEWMLSYAQLNEEEANVESLALRAIQTVEKQLRTNNINYLEIMEIFAKERLHMMLQRNESSLPTTMVYKRKTMQHYLEKHWYYEWQAAEEPAEGDVLRQKEPEADHETAYETKSISKSKPINFEQVIQQAQAALTKSQEKTRDRRTLTVLNEPLDKIERTMQRCDRQAILDRKNQQLKQEKTENFEQPVKRQRLAAPADESSALLDRTERLLNNSQATEERRSQVLQRANKFI